MQRLNYIFDTIPDVKDSSGALAQIEIEGSIEFRNLDFAYNGKRTLRNISLVIPKGKTVAIVGATGSGKSTLVQLIPRLYNAPPNSLFIDGIPIERIPIGTLRRSIGFIPQDTFLFGETIRENIAFGVEAASDQNVKRAAGISHIDADVEGFPNQYETVVGERGITLSGGQKQRVTLARVLAGAPRVLVLDDALSSVDAATEREILERLHDFFRDRTTILVAHRLTTVKEADLIVVLDEGRVAETGDHDALLERGGLYADLFRQQVLEGELEAI